MANNIAVSITADVADLVAKRAIMSAELKAATADLNNFARTARTSGMTDELRASMQQAATAVATTRAEIRGLDGEMKELAANKSPFTRLGAEISEAREGVMAFGEAMVAAFAVERVVAFSEQMGEAAEKVVHTAEAFGLSAGDVQRFNAEMMELGIAPEAGQQAFVRLDGALTRAREGMKAQAAAFKEIGVNIREPMGQIQLFNTTIADLAQVQDVPTRIGLAMQLMGRNVQAIAPLLGVTKEQFDAVNQSIEASGAVDEAAVQKGLALAEAQNEQKVAMQGLGNTLTTALAPAFTAATRGVTELIEGFVRSYKEGGAAKDVMDALGVVLKVLISIVEGLAIGVEVLVSWFNGAAYAGATLANVLIDTLGGALRTVTGLAWGLGEVLSDVFSGRFDKAVSDADSALRGFGRNVGLTMENIARDAKAGGQKTAENFAEGLKAFGAGGENLRSLWGMNGPEQLPALPKGGGGSLADMQENLGHGKKGRKAPKESALDTLREQLETLENAHNDTIQDMTAVELAFWQKVAAGPEMATLNAREQAQVRMSILRLEHQEAMKAIQEEIAADEEAQRRKTRAIEQQATRAKAALELQVKATQDAENRGEISHPDATAAIEAAYAQEREVAIDAANAIRDATIAAQDAIEARVARGTSEFRAAEKAKADAADAAQKAILAADDSFNAQMQAKAEAEANRFKQAWDSVVKPLVSSFTSGLEKMAEGTQTFLGFMRSMGQQILGDFTTRVVNPMIEQWLLGEARKSAGTATGAAVRTGIEQSGFFGKLLSLLGIGTATHVTAEATKTGATIAGVAIRSAAEITGATATTVTKKIIHSTEITQDAGEAAAGAYKAMVGIPVIGPILAPAAAAVAFAGVEAFAAGGYDVPAHVNPVTQLHAREMVLPANIADPMRAMLAGFPAGSTTNRGGDFHSSFSPTIHAGPGLDGHAIVKALEGAQGAHLKLLKNMHRNGHFDFAGR